MSSRMHVRVLAVFLSMLVVELRSVSGQELLWKVFGENPEDRLGSRLKFGGNSDVDVGPDLVVGAIGSDCGQTDAGEVRLLRGSDGSSIAFACGLDGTYFFAFAVAGDIDVDQDGVADFIVGANADSRGVPGGGSYAIYSGEDGSLLREGFGSIVSEGLGVAVASLADIDGDAVRDYVISSPRDDPTAHATVYSGLTGEVIFTLSANPPDSGFGLSLSDAGDVNADGIADIAVGNLKGDGTGAYPNPGEAWIFSGADGTVLYDFQGEHTNSKFGASVAGIGDIDGDGYGEFLVGSPDYLLDYVDKGGRLYVYSGRDGSLIQSLDGIRNTSELGAQVSRAGDVNRDGVPDYLALDPGYWTGPSCNTFGAVLVISGRTGRTLYHFDDTFGPITELTALDGGADVDGDGRPEVAIGFDVDDEGGNNAGAVRIYSMKDLCCDAEPKVQCEDWDVSITIGETPPGNLVGLALVGVDGAPTFSFLMVAPTDSLGRFVLSGAVPTGLGGHYFDFQSFGVGWSGKVVASASERVTFRP